MFFVGAAAGAGRSLLSAILLTLAILIGIFATFAASRLLSKTLLRGTASSFTLELPPYRRPQFGRVIVRSMLDRTLFALGRAAAVAAPAGLILYVLANVGAGEGTLLTVLASSLDPFARVCGLDGVILLAFILGLPANEIVFPIILMAYLSGGTIQPMSELSEIRQILIANGWTWKTAVSTMLFSLMHWPCSTTILTIKKETGSLRWTAAAILLPTVFGLASCMLFNTIANLLG